VIDSGMECVSTDFLKIPIFFIENIEYKTTIKVESQIPMIATLVAFFIWTNGYCQFNEQKLISDSNLSIYQFHLETF
jgi:hypothetical protein